SRPDARDYRSMEDLVEGSAPPGKPSCTRQFRSLSQIGPGRPTLKPKFVIGTRIPVAVQSTSNPRSSTEFNTGQQIPARAQLASRPCNPLQLCALLGINNLCQ